MEGLLAGGVVGDEEEEDELEEDDGDDDLSEYSGRSGQESDGSGDSDEEEPPPRKAKRAKGNGGSPVKHRTAKSKEGKLKEAMMARIMEPQQQVHDKRPLGLIVEEKQKVVETQVLNCVRKPANVICRVDAFSKLVDKLDKTRRKVVVDMGFGSLLNLKVNRLDRKFCYWLLSRVDAENCAMVFGDGKRLPLCPVQWNCVLGIPKGGESVPLTCEEVDENMQRKIGQIGSWFGIADAKGRSHLSISSAECGVLNKWKKDDGPLEDEGDVLHFRYAFLVVVLGQLLCPSTDGGNLSLSLLPAASVVDKAEIYNWCDFCFDWLMSYELKFRRKFEKYGFVAGCGGCTLFLVLFYIDHLDITPNEWSEMPRIDV